ncbi:hypothetical protein GGR20_000896 [Devosia subaequoris]|uniref:Sulfotransferase n=1 Tax=Devosia subaequoris TaxID=395930 RepID=A0A7W6IKJ3_9HYPH|nr:sulfotransferase [Devosia subaequoris]MBB4051278.1 hypothetical protein [Devosia subaequoris]MCP1211423.1 sulfotransferase [Devosia subaequoris]
MSFNHATNRAGQLPIRFIDVSGIGSSGKSAVTDLLREFDSLYVPHFQFEFDLIRAPGGLLDLRHAASQDWSPVRSHAALKRFSRLVYTLGADPRPWQIGAMIRSASQRYSRHFGPGYFDVWDEFCAALLALRYRAEWPYDDYEIPGAWRLAKRLLKRFGLREHFLHDVTVIDGRRFDLLASRAMQRLYAPLLKPGQTGAILNNAIEPFNPTPGLDMLGNARQIVVVRDPRDVFATGQKRSSEAARRSMQAFDNDGLNKTFLAADDVNAFCLRHRLHWDALPKADNPRVLRVWFEELVAQPARTIATICAFLELDPAHHTAPNTAFKPEVSRESVGTAKLYPDQQSISVIAQTLADCLYPNW